MPSFGKLFMESKGQPIQYEGNELTLADKFPVKNGDVLLCSIEKTSGSRRQGFCIDITGYCEMNGKVLKEGKGIRLLLWEDTAPKQFRIKVFTNKEFVWVYNICEWEERNHIGDMKRTLQCRHSGAAMIVEEIENGRRYRCSDTSGTNKENQFGDIIFTVQKFKE